METNKNFWTDLQTKVGRWARENFPDTCDRKYHPLLGIGEEIGELAEHIYDPSHMKHADAIGDICIYMADYCYRNDHELNAGWANGPTTVTGCMMRIMAAYGQLNHAHLKSEQGIRGTSEQHHTHAQEAIDRLTSALGKLCILENMELETVVREVWTTTVQKRNWKRNQADGSGTETTNR